MAKGILNVGGGVVSVDASGNFTVETGLIADGASVFNETGVDVDFRIESDDNANMLFVDGGNDRVGIGVATPAAQLEVEQGSTGGVVAFTIDNNDTDKVAMSIEAANIDANVMDITMDAVTTADGINITADGLTTGSALSVVSDSSSNGTRNIVEIIQDNASATGSTALKVQQDSTGTGSALIVDSQSTSSAAFTSNGQFPIVATQDIDGGYVAVFQRNRSEAGAFAAVSVKDTNTSSTATAFYVQHDGTGDLVNFFDGGTERFTILDGGNVGINTTAPAAALTVIGTMNVGVNDTGHDVTFYGATAGRSLLWDESADELIVTGKISVKRGSAFQTLTTSSWVMGG